MKMIAITGRSGCGKSSVSAYLREKGYTVIDADLVARQIMEPPSPCPQALAKEFGEDILDENGNLKRRMLANRAFATPQGTQALTRITFPEIRRRILEQVKEATLRGERLCFVDGAVIVGTPMEPEFERIILVETPLEESIRRISARDGISPEMARRRLDAQTPVEQLEQAAHVILKNEGSLDQLHDLIDEMINELLKTI